MVSKLAVGIVVVIVIVVGGAAAYVLTRPPGAAETYTLTTSISSSGSGSVSPSSGTYDAGTSVTLTATPASGYQFDYWSGDTSGTSASVTITMDSNKSVVAHFKAIPETYELFHDYQVGEYYNYKMTTATTVDNTSMENILSTYSMQIIAVEDNEITVRSTTTVENIGPPSYEYTIENAEVTMIATMTNKGEMISWEIENVVPLEYWDNVELYENYQMVWSQLVQTIYVFPGERVSIGQEWENSIDGEIPWGPGMYMTLTGEGSAHLMGQENITVEVGTFDCWRIDYNMNISGELYTYAMNMMLEGTTWYSRQNCAEIKSTMFMTISTEYDNYQYEHLSETVSELIEYVTV